jgi:predicted transposase/invertase (TIGR01784 family)
MTDILPPKSDEVFKMLFGDAQDTEILVGFLKAVLPLPGDDYDDITIMNPFLPGEALGEKVGILDLRVKTKTGKQIDVEIQVANHAAFKTRILYYLTRLFTSQITEGEEYGVLKPTIGVVITDFVCIADSSDYHNVYRFCDLESRSVFSDDLSLHMLELPKVAEDDEHTELWAWLEFLKAQNEEELSMLVKEHPTLQPAVRKLTRLSADEEARLIHEAREKARRDELMWRNEATAKGLAEGLAKGRMEGRTEGRMEGRDEARLGIARNLLRLGRPVEEIMLATGLAREDILGMKA